MSLANSDENKTFGVVLRTPVENSKGIPHILEHSVLCGSRKYPIKVRNVIIKSETGAAGILILTKDRRCMASALLPLLKHVRMCACYFIKGVHAVLVLGLCALLMRQQHLTNICLACSA